MKTAVEGTVVLETCNRYPDGTSIDTNWKSARAFSTMTLIIGGIVTFISLLSCIINPSSTAYKAGGMLFLLCCLFQGLSLLMLDSNACKNNIVVDNLEAQFNSENSNQLQFNETCSMGQGAKCAIAATIFWFVAGVAAMKVKPQDREPNLQQTHDAPMKSVNDEKGKAVELDNVIEGEPAVVGQGAGEA